MKDEFAWLRLTFTLCAGAFFLGLVVHVCRDSAQRRAGLESAVAADIMNARTNPAAVIVQVPPRRIVPASALPSIVPVQPEE